MRDNQDDTFEIFAIWEYDSYEDYVKIEMNLRNDQAHVQRVMDWYKNNGGKEHVLSQYILEVRNEELESTSN